MTRYTVILEKFNYEGCKRVTVMADTPYEAMATAQLKYRGWTPVDVVVA